MELNATLIGQLITFAILVWFTMKYVWPPITKGINEREKKIAAGLQYAERAKHDLEAAEHKALHIIKEARQEAAHIIEQTHKRSVQIIDEAKKNAREESQRILAHAQDEITREINQAKEALRKQLASLAVAGAEKIIKRNLDAATQSALLDEFVAEL